MLDFTRTRDKVFVNSLPTDTQNLNALERTIYSTVKNKCLYDRLLQKNAIPNLDLILEPNKNRLQTLWLTPTKEMQDRRQKLILYGMLAIGGIGSLKIYFGIINERPIGFLFFLIGLFILILSVKIKTNPITTMGTKFLALVASRFEASKEQPEENTDSYQDDSMLYSVAIFGTLALSNTSLANTMGYSALAGSASGSDSSDTWGDTGGSSDSDSSSDSGSSDSGSSDSGCGGCGGGGCGGD